MALNLCKQRKKDKKKHNGNAWYLGLYKVEFRILEIRISGETNLKKHFLSGNWIRKKIFWAEKTFEFWISAEDSLWI